MTTDPIAIRDFAKAVEELDYDHVQGLGACPEKLEGSANVVKAASVAWRQLTQDAERWFCELDWMIDGLRD